MPRFAANLSMLYNELDFLDRFAAAASDGFTAVEYLFPYAWAPERLSALLRQHGLQQVLFNAPPGDWDAGERGLACIPGREGEFLAGLERAIAYARALDGETFTIVCNMSGEEAQMPSAPAGELVLSNVGNPAQERMMPYEARVYRAK